MIFLIIIVLPHLNFILLDINDFNNILLHSVYYFLPQCKYVQFATLWFRVHVQVYTISTVTNQILIYKYIFYILRGLFLKKQENKYFFLEKIFII